MVPQAPQAALPGPAPAANVELESSEGIGPALVAPDDANPAANDIAPSTMPERNRTKRAAKLQGLWFRIKKHIKRGGVLRAIDPRRLLSPTVRVEVNGVVPNPAAPRKLLLVVAPPRLSAAATVHHQTLCLSQICADMLCPGRTRATLRQVRRTILVIGLRGKPSGPL